jgi:hypothetical protein
MNRFLMLGFLTVLFSLSLHAAQNASKVTFLTPLQVGTTTLPAGDYKATWTGNGPDVQLTLEVLDVRGQKPVTVPAHLVVVKSSSRSVETNTVNGKNTLQKIILKEITLVLSPAGASGM